MNNKCNPKLRYIIFFILCLVKGLNNSSLYTIQVYDIVTKALSYAVYVFFLIIVVGIKWNRRSILMKMALLLLLSISVVISKENFLFITMLGLLAASDLSYYQINRNMFYGTLIIFLCIFLCSLIGVFPIIDKEWEGEIRYAMGFRHSNNMGLYCMTLTVMYLSIKCEKLKLKHVIFPITLLGLMQVTCKTRAASIGIIACIVLTFMLKKCLGKMIENKIIQIGLICFVPMCMIITVAFAYLYTTSIFLQNVYSSDRLFLNYVYFNYQPLRLFSAPFELPNWYLDSSYARLVVFSGIVPALAYCIMNYLIIKKAIFNRNVSILISVLIFGIYGLVETGSLFFWFNSSLLYLFTKNEENANDIQRYIE